MRPCFVLFVLTALTCEFAANNPAHAQEPRQIALPPYAGPPNNYAPYAPEEDLVERLGLNPTGPELKRRHPLCNLYKKSPLYCVGHHNSVGCGTLEAELVFIFGSCRQFYGEPCFKGPNPYPHPWWNKGAGCASCGQ